MTAPAIVAKKSDASSKSFKYTLCYCKPEGWTVWYIFYITCLNRTRRHLCGYESNLLSAVKCCTCLCGKNSQGWQIMQYITVSPATFPLADWTTKYWDIWLRRKKWNVATYWRCCVLTLTWAMLFSMLLMQLKGSWPKMPSLYRMKYAQGTLASKWRACSNTSHTPCISEIRRGLTRKARASWLFITWRS